MQYQHHHHHHHQQQQQHQYILSNISIVKEKVATAADISY